MYKVCFCLFCAYHFENTEYPTEKIIHYTVISIHKNSTLNTKPETGSNQNLDFWSRISILKVIFKLNVSDIDLQISTLDLWPHNIKQVWYEWIYVIDKRCNFPTYPVKITACPRPGLWANLWEIGCCCVLWFLSPYNLPESLYIKI